MHQSEVVGVGLASGLGLGGVNTIGFDPKSFASSIFLLYIYIYIDKLFGFVNIFYASILTIIDALLSNLKWEIFLK